MKCRTLFATMTCASLLFIFAGCGQPSAEKFPTPEKKDKGPKKEVINQVTDDIGEFDANAGEVKEADMQVKSNSGPLSAYSGAYGYAVSATAKMKITQAVEMFRATEGRYPKSHDEFMAKVIKANQIQLPVLPGEREYQYDVENHELKVVEPNKEK